jgi:polysaccharide deacetylase 2 family uncharacterized protein YibQ
LDDLNTPLAAAPAKRRWPMPKVSAAQVTAGLLGLFLATFVVWAAVVKDPLGGEPLVVATLQRPIATTAPSASAPSKAPATTAEKSNSHYDGPATEAGKAAPVQPPGRTVTIIDGSSGKREEVVIPGPVEPKKAETSAAPAADERLLETTRHGRIPKIAPDGHRAVVAYARPSPAADLAADGPKVAIVVSGLGVGTRTTVDTLARLPPSISLAFIPYGADLASLVAQARERGHEVLLQAPMEPFDYPDNDPGPRTLLSGLPREQNLDRLHWLMSRLQGYVGITNYMGAKFVTSEKALTPVMDDVGSRGLMYFDDGSSARSHASQIAAANNIPFAKAEVTIDAVPSPAEIDRALLRLEQIARQRGIAVGHASALPVIIDRIALWARRAESRGIRLVPITAVALKPKSS